jgi:WD40 repeat protein
MKLWRLNANNVQFKQVIFDDQVKHTRTIRRIAWRADSRMIAAASFDSTVSLWYSSIKDGLEFLVKLSGQESEVKCVSFSPCGEYLATCSRDKSIWVFDTSGLLGESRNSGSDEFQRLQLEEESQEGEFVFPTSPSVVRSRGLRTEELECLAILEGHSQDVKALRFHPLDPHMLVSVSYDDSIKIWRSTTSDDWELSETLRGHKGTVWDICFNPSCRSEFVTVSADGSMKIWTSNPPQSPIPASSAYLLSGPLGASSRHHMKANSYDLISESWSCQTIQVTSTRTEGIPPAPVYSVDWTEDGLLAVACGDDTIRIYKRHGRSTIPACTIKLDSEPNCVSFRPVRSENGSRLLAVAQDDGLVSIYEVDDRIHELVCE